MATLLYLYRTKKPSLRSSLLERLAELFELVESSHLESLEESFDLCLLEAKASALLIERVKERKRREAPVLVPFLHVVEAGEDDDLTAVCDEGIAPGIPPATLVERVERWLALRHLSREWAERLRREGEPPGWERLRSILYSIGSIGDGVIATDRDGRIEVMNPAAERLTGWREEEALGRPLEEVFRIVNEQTRKPVWRVLEEGGVRGLANHTLLISRTGEEFAIADSGAPIFDEAGEVRGAVLVFRDQTEERRIQREIAEARAFAEAVIETLHEALLVLDAELRVVTANPAFYRLFQTSPEETVGAYFYELGNGQWDIPELRRLLGEILPKNTSFSGYEIAHDFPNLGRRIMRCNARRICREGRKTGMILLAVEDVTERRRAERELRRREAYLTSIWESTPEMLLLVGRDGTLLDGNPVARRLLGKSEVDELGNLFDYLGDEAQTAMRRTLADGWKGHRRLLEVRWRRPPEPDRWLGVRVAPLFGASEELSGVLLLAVDVTERRRAEQRVVRLNRMLSLLSEVNQTIVRERNVDTLLERACQIAVEEGQFMLAWIGLLDGASGAVRVAAAAGGPESYLEKLRINLQDPKRRGGPTGLCLRTGEVFLANDLANDPRMAPWREDALRAGFHSSAAFPLKIFGKVQGTLNLYSAEPGFFSDEEVGLLQELATDLSFALEFNEREKRREAAEEALRVSEERFRVLAEQSLVGIYLMREEGFLYVNRAFAELFGYDREEIIQGLKPLDLAAEADRQLAAENIRKRLSGEVPFVRYVFRGRRKDGSTIFLDTHGARIELPDGPAILGALVDVTQRVEMEQELRRSREMLQLVLDTVPVRIFWKDRNSVFLGCNRPFALDAGLARPEEVVGKTDFDLGWSEDAARYRADDARVMETGEPLVGYEEPQHALDGSVRWLRTSKVPLRDEAGGITGILGTYEDITEQKLARQALEESEERFRVVVENTAAAFFFYDRDGYVFVNPAAERLTGYTREELREIPPWELAAPEFRAEAREVAERRLAGDRELRRYVLRVLRKDGAERWVDLQSVGITWQGRPAGLISALDITERRKLEMQLAQAQKMEAVGQLAGGVAHDFNNMLSVILGYAELARLRVPETDPLWSDLEEIRLAAQRSADLTRKLLAFARKQIISPRPVDLNRVVEESLRSLRRLIPEEIRIDFVPGKDLWTVNLDPTQIDQILINLATNARDAIAGVGSILIETKNIVLDEEFIKRHLGSRSGEYVQLVFSDTGCGMDQETLKHIFEPFFTTKEPGQGTGLGLATVYGIVKQNDGYISVYSEPGGGTVFKIYFRRFTPQEEPAEVPGGTEEAELRGSERILVVEDEAQILSLCETCLRNLGYQVLSAQNPRMALEMVSRRGEKVDLLITDVVMPEMNGKQLWERIRTHSPQAKVLFMSGYTQNSIAHRGILDPDMNFINKPFSLEALARKVRQALDS